MVWTYVNRMNPHPTHTPSPCYPPPHTHTPGLRPAALDNHFAHGLSSRSCTCLQNQLSTHPAPLLPAQSAKANNGLGGETYINRYDASIVETEEESAFVSKMFEPKMPVVINEQERNKWGSPRGYKVSRREQAVTSSRVFAWGLCVGRRWSCWVVLVVVVVGRSSYGGPDRGSPACVLL